MRTRTKFQFCIILLTAEAAILVVRAFGIYAALLILLLEAYLLISENRRPT